MTKIRRILTVRPSDAGSIARAYYYLAVAGWRLFIRRENLGRWLLSPSEQPLLPPVDEARMRNAALWTNRAARIPLPIARCLQRSLALCLWLERDGYRPALQVGARREGGQFDAHAWVEYRGQVLNDREYVKTLFPRLSSTASMTMTKRS